MRYASLILTLCVELLGLGSLNPVTASTDCSERFQPGAYGVSVDDSAVRAGELTVSGFAPVSLEKRRIEASDPAECPEAVYNYFRLIPGQQSSGLLAGCYGDFDGDGRRDYALLLREVGGTKVIPFVFLARTPHYLAISLDPLDSMVALHEFDDPLVWTGPFCKKKPDNGIFRALGKMIRVFGDLIQVGYYGYYWLPAEQRFQGVLITD